MRNLKDWIIAKLDKYGVWFVLALYLDHADVFHSEPVKAGLLGAGQESTDNVDIITAVVKGIACFFGVC